MDTKTAAHIPPMLVTLCDHHDVMDAGTTWGGITPGWTAKPSKAKPSPMGCEVCGRQQHTNRVVRLTWPSATVTA